MYANKNIIIHARFKQTPLKYGKKFIILKNTLKNVFLELIHKKILSHYLKFVI